jgi:zinc and cadmium transporter
MNLIGDSVHNFIDGLILAATFMTSVPLGIATTITVAMHEVPQEIGDFGVLLYSGFEKKKALISNFCIACIAILGGVTGYFLSLYSRNFMTYLLPFAAGGFIYIAASDLMPEIRKEQSLKRTIASFGMFLVGIAIMVIVKISVRNNYGFQRCGVCNCIGYSEGERCNIRTDRETCRK